MEPEFNARVIEEFRAGSGRVGGPFAGTTLMLIHHVGARSGIERVSPVGCSDQGDGRYAIVAANGGSPAHPAWYHNLRANPTITAELGARTCTMHAEEVADTDAHERLWRKLAVEFPHLREFQARTSRRIPLFLLSPRD